MAYQIVPMTAAHVRQIAALETRCFSDPWPEAAITPELTNELSLWLVAVSGETVLGYVGSQTVMGESDMMNLAVSPEFRRQGIARALVTALCRALAQKQSRCLTLEVRASNEAAIRLYAALDFAPVGRRPNYYSHPKEDALILRKEWSYEHSGD